ncbi:hypothetical protein [Sphingomonas sp. 2SG]|uniref:hypothetical protein n=1 Tax=Sphingomonas sp. 2SG TaxID=2502201 RepID=UPI0010F5E52B|nr:hypothetical protein [Sphingomonas sp. 2SG]
MTFAASVFAALSIATSATASSEPPPPPALQALVVSSDYQANIARLFSQLPAPVLQRCPSLISKGSTVTMIEPVSFAPDGYPTSGLWEQSFPVSGCGNDTTINFFFRAQSDEKITSIVGVPGETHADVILQSDAVGMMATAVKAAAPNCEQITVQDSKYLGPVGKSHKAWQESWLLAVCARPTHITLTFTPDDTGTKILVSPVKQMP